MNYLGIDIGGTKIKTVILNGNNDILEQQEIPTEDGSGEVELWKKKIIAIIDEKTAKYAQGKKESLCCGISAPGLVDSENKMTLHMPVRLQGIESFNWSDALEREIKVINDGHSACLAEYESFYRANEIQNMLLLTLGTGVGGGIIIHGKIYQGNLQRAGHVGHMTVDYKGPSTMTNMPGSLEHAIGNFSVAERTEGHYKSTRELLEAHKKGIAKASGYWLESVKKLAVALASLTNILSPEIIVLGGGITAGTKESLMEPLKSFMADYEWRPGTAQIKIVEAKHGSYAGAIGAAYFAKSKM
ncbi:MAG: ROK family protein [Flavobacteriaceae bacterium]